MTLRKITVDLNPPPLVPCPSHPGEVLMFCPQCVRQMHTRLTAELAQAQSDARILRELLTEIHGDWLRIKEKNNIMATAEALAILKAERAALAEARAALAEIDDEVRLNLYYRKWRIRHKSAIQAAKGART